MGFFEQLAEWVRANPGKTVGAAGGFLAGILLLTIGWWKTLIVLVLAGAGFLVGKSRDDNISIVDLVTGFFRRNRD